MTMEKPEKLEDFYKRKFDWIPENLRQDIGHFNVFQLENLVGKPLPYRRRDFYKVMVVRGNNEVHFADRIVEVKKQALSFSSPAIPYKWEHLDDIRDGAFCIFDQHFFHQFGNLNQYAVFQPEGQHLFELTDEQVKTVREVFDRMFVEIKSDYIHKYDVLRNLVFELLHFAMKLQPSAKYERKGVDAAQRISALFVELLERQFPIEENHPQVKLRTAADFARQLNVHVNHLNRAVKGTLGKTTTQVIAERILQEAKVMLKHSSWNVSEVAFALGFKEATHFNNFFKKHMETSPVQFRKSR